MSLFKRKVDEAATPLPTDRVDYPDGVCVLTESGRWYLAGGRKFRIDSEQVYKSWSFPIVCQSTDAAIAHFTKSVKPLNFRQGTVVRDVFSFELYISARNGLIPLKDANLYRWLNIREDQIVFASNDEISMHRRYNN